MDDHFRERQGAPESSNEHNHTLMSGNRNGGGDFYSDPPVSSGAPGGNFIPSSNSHFFLKLVLRRWKTMLLFVLLGILIGFVYIMTARRYYKAEAVIEMNVRRPKVVSSEAVIEDTGTGRDSDAIFNTRFEKFKSPAMEDLAAREFFKRYPEPKSEDNPSGINKYALAEMIRHVEWSKDPDANIVRVSYVSPYPRFAANLVNVLSDCAGQLMMEENQALSDEAVKWLISQVEDKREELESVESQLAEIRKKVQIDSLQQRKDALAQAMGAVAQEKEGLVSKLTGSKTEYEFVAGLKDTEANLEVLPPGLPKEDELNELIRQWREAHDELQQIAARYTSVHPAYRLAEEKDERARARLDQFIDLSAKSVQNEMDLLEKQIKLVDQRVDEMKSESLSLEQKLAAGMQQVQQQERKRDAADNSYQTMLRRMEEARLSADENMAFTKVIRKAAVPRVPVSPRKPVVLVLSVVFAGLIGFGGIAFMELWRDVVSSVNDLRALNLRILGIIPSQKKVDSRGELATIGLRDKFSAIVEIFSGINALLSSEKYRRHAQVLLFCSIVPGEGKTVASCNLAISSALNGIRTLLIDGDLRRPQLVNVFAIDENHPSLLEWLVDGDSALDCDDLILKNVIENLDVIPSRPLADINPAELLGRGRLKDLLNWARKHYDRVIIDSPPLGPVGDAQVIANCTDGVIFVARIGKTHRKALKYALARFHELEVHVLGCIANDVPYSLAGMFSGAEGYGYGYGYHTETYKAYGRD